MKTTFLTALLLSAVARSTGSHNNLAPGCAYDCADHMTANRVNVNLKMLCSDISLQRSLFQCLETCCQQHYYGPALASVATTCSDLGANIGMLHPVELLQPDLLPRNLITSLPGFVKYGSTGFGNSGLSSPSQPYAVALGCDAGSDGVLTLSQPYTNTLPTDGPCPENGDGISTQLGTGSPDTTQESSSSNAGSLTPDLAGSEIPISNGVPSFPVDIESGTDDASSLPSTSGSAPSGCIENNELSASASNLSPRTGSDQLPASPAGGPGSQGQLSQPQSNSDAASVYPNDGSMPDGDSSVSLSGQSDASALPQNVCEHDSAQPCQPGQGHDSPTSQASSKDPSGDSEPCFDPGSLHTGESPDRLSTNGGGSDYSRAGAGHATEQESSTQQPGSSNDNSSDCNNDPENMTDQSPSAPPARASCKPPNDFGSLAPSGSGDNNPCAEDDESDFVPTRGLSSPSDATDDSGNYTADVTENSDCLAPTPSPMGGPFSDASNASPSCPEANGEPTCFDEGSNETFQPHPLPDTGDSACLDDGGDQPCSVADSGADVACSDDSAASSDGGDYGASQPSNPGPESLPKDTGSVGSAGGASICNDGCPEDEDEVSGLRMPSSDPTDLSLGTDEPNDQSQPCENGNESSIPSDDGSFGDGTPTGDPDGNTGANGAEGSTPGGESTLWPLPGGSSSGPKVPPASMAIASSSEEETAVVETSITFVKAQPPSDWVPVTTTAPSGSGGSVSESTLWSGADETSTPSLDLDDNQEGKFAQMLVTIIASNGGDGVAATAPDGDSSQPPVASQLVGQAQPYTIEKKRDMIDTRVYERSSLENGSIIFWEPARSTTADVTPRTTENAATSGNIVTPVFLGCTCLLTYIIRLSLF